MSAELFTSPSIERQEKIAAPPFAENRATADTAQALRDEMLYSARRHDRPSCHQDEFARGHRELEVLVDAPNAPANGLSDMPDRLAPTEVLLDAFSIDLAGN